MKDIILEKLAALTIGLVMTGLTYLIISGVQSL